MEYFRGNRENVGDTYDMHDSVQRKGGIRIILGFIIPAVLFVTPAVWLIHNDGNVIATVALIILAVFFMFYCVLTAYIKNIQENIGNNTSTEDLKSARIIRSFVCCLFACFTFIPFFPYIVARIAAKKHNYESFFCKEGMNVQNFALMWSFVSLFGIGLFVLLYALGEL